MHPFDPTETAPSLLDVLETTITTIGALNAQEAGAASTVAKHQGNIDALEETARNREAVTAAHAERRRRAAAISRVRSEELREKLEETPFELELDKSPTLILPDELMAEIFDYMWKDGLLTTMLLVCKRWSMVAYSSPRLWARISVTNHPSRHQKPDQRRLPGSILCADLDYLRLLLSRSRSCPLQLDLCISLNPSPRHLESSSSSLLMPEPQATANYVEAVKLILDDQVLRRCTVLVLGGRFLPFDYQNATVLPLLSSIQIHSAPIVDRELLFIQSLADLSPALRHIHCDSGLSAENKGVGLWTKRIESYRWISTSSLCSPLHESPSLRKLGIQNGPAEPLTLPALQVLWWAARTYDMFHRVTAPHLHTLILRHGPFDPEPAGSISFPNLRVAIHEKISSAAHLHMFRTPALEHLSIKYGASLWRPTALLDLFDGSTHMPTPKSIHLDCTFTDAVLIAVLDRLPWLEELQVAGTAVEDTFWERLVPSFNPSQQIAPATLLTDERATPILVSNLKVLLVHYPTGTQGTSPTPNQQGEVAQVSKLPDEVSNSVDWRLAQASAVAVAREQAGCPLGTLACWSSEQKVDVLVGSLDGLPYRPKFVSSTALLCYWSVLTFTTDRWDDPW